ncbi:Tricarboxylate transport protein TctC [Candidatus Rhodobacter oscarellae]|uniref:Tricarboxylate transport protein TctC n=1 Tax=Candidatus Rhodobacter oscarellae TaxID=1675527 RepID=A0A0J9H0B4_9RHOB|nr:tripartite tricarboxylate transporter substrate binding protein [Candidatus Rhodobacter lobularis]KMW59173.1 Tricarboxylate transport protein TctC [Candidatus Rhodobacter lobularis]
MSLTKRTFAGLAAAAVMAFGMGQTATAGSHAFEPSKPIDFVIMAGKGGGADKMARLMQSIIEQEGLSSRPVVPTNKPGGSGAEALVHLNSATDPDHTIMVTLNSFFTTPLRQPGLGVDIMTFAPIGRMAEDTFLLWVHKDEGITSFDQFVEEAKSRGSGWVMGGTGKNSEDNIITDHLNATFGLDIKYIPYKGGGEVAKQLAGQQITSSVNNPSEALGFYESGDVIPLVAFTDERLALFPDVPTLKETGNDFSYFMQRAVVGAPGMSDEALGYYNNLFQQVFETDAWQEYRTKKALLGAKIEGDELRAYWETQRNRHEGILKASGAIN